MEEDFIENKKGKEKQDFRLREKKNESLCFSLTNFRYLYTQD